MSASADFEHSASNLSVLERGKWEWEWKVLGGVPPILKRDQTRFEGSFSYEDGKRILILVKGFDHNEYFCTYDAEYNSWSTKRVNCRHKSFPPKGFDLFEGKSFVINGSNFAVEAAVLAPLGLMNVVSLTVPPFRKGYNSYSERGGVYPHCFHILPFGNKKFCLLSLYAHQTSQDDYACPNWKYYVQFGTFDLVEDRSSDALFPPKQKKPPPLPAVGGVNIPFPSKLKVGKIPPSRSKFKIRKRPSPPKPTYQYKIDNLDMRYIDIAVQKETYLEPYNIVCRLCTQV
ncbi:hypothetical protein COLO4_25987 [Corchorus olitorius]|uniref:Uncharacterized protein n=1 Tax=Corchorus olitorius TaxID=93759 RepID=A0A1R3HZ34_9ROSI|nr:hypothetical protein COLO4_25987 [Corchorus olitorius]